MEDFNTKIPLFKKIDKEVFARIDKFKQTLEVLSSMIANNDSTSLTTALAKASHERSQWQLADKNQEN